ncbi:ATP-binding protein [Rathayibacter tritici]|uniref:Uncharacterized protein n=1 Tax=Rathayibacter tritici TaxID=33888 RepID=A0A160KVQ1_9MICO|nr:ATP-binding protein [Rathayibacter tritici]AND17843.1 hypothetical protein A6122_2732 [Rathayibacter tritici]PPF22854.1 ATP-binding protein [Rathayibacter tritici]PPF63269.1 ATP-binding protein [Rathayibacter tritici]PPG02158.1 ATP-binding protein [Rathayibacter tritici]PPI17899.1 ATP-binding protein [Rathayibacter tritici]
MTAEPGDAREDNRIVLGAMALLGGVLSLLAALQAVFALGILSQTLRGIDPGPLLDVTTRVLVNVSTIALAIALVALLRPERFAGGDRIARTALIAVGVGVVRCTLQVLTGIYPIAALPAIVIELVVGSVVVALICGYGYLLVRAARRVREKEREHARARVQAIEAVQALQREELRVRRDVAQSLHGRLQNGLVVLAAELHAVASAADPDVSARLLAIAARLDRLREEEVRTVGHALYPVEIDHGLVAAVRDLLARLPPEIAVDLDLGRISELSAEGREPPLDQRLLLVRLVEEGLTNALKHGCASSLRVRGAVQAGVVVLTLDDDGSGVAAGSTRSGLSRLDRQLAVYGGSLALSDSPVLAGARLRVRLPLCGGASVASEAQAG